ncbi:hypothetical protein AAG570_006146 [Ranatra chinensis]|uniref:Uncharacterized protein n=1 Tax=Ranatra chinensis TaxID=642074 RepID=A0ABD0XY81_9HEMI
MNNSMRVFKSQGVTPKTTGSPHPGSGARVKGADLDSDSRTKGSSREFKGSSDHNRAFRATRQGTAREDARNFPSKEADGKEKEAQKKPYQPRFKIVAGRIVPVDIVNEEGTPVPQPSSSRMDGSTSAAPHPKKCGPKLDSQPARQHRNGRVSPKNGKNVSARDKKVEETQCRNKDVQDRLKSIEERKAPSYMQEGTPVPQPSSSRMDGSTSAAPHPKKCGPKLDSQPARQHRNGRVSPTNSKNVSARDKKVEETQCRNKGLQERLKRVEERKPTSNTKARIMKSLTSTSTRLKEMQWKSKFLKEWVRTKERKPRSNTNETKVPDTSQNDDFEFTSQNDDSEDTSEEDCVSTVDKFNAAMRAKRLEKYKYHRGLYSRDSREKGSEPNCSSREPQARPVAERPAGATGGILDSRAVWRLWDLVGKDCPFRETKVPDTSQSHPVEREMLYNFDNMTEEELRAVFGSSNDELNTATCAKEPEKETIVPDTSQSDPIEKRDDDSCEKLMKDWFDSTYPLYCDYQRNKLLNKAIRKAAKGITTKPGTLQSDGSTSSWDEEPYVREPTCVEERRSQNDTCDQSIASNDRPEASMEVVAMAATTAPNTSVGLLSFSNRPSNGEGKRPSHIYDIFPGFYLPMATTPSYGNLSYNYGTRDQSSASNDHPEASVKENKIQETATPIKKGIRKLNTKTVEDMKAWLMGIPKDSAIFTLFEGIPEMCETTEPGTSHRDGPSTPRNKEPHVSEPTCVGGRRSQNGTRERSSASNDRPEASVKKHGSRKRREGALVTKSSSGKSSDKKPSKPVCGSKSPDHYDPNGFNHDDYDPDGYKRGGYDPNGGNDYNRDGYDPYGGNAYNRNDYDPNGGNDYNRDGYDPYGGNDCNRNDYGPYGGNNYDCDSYDPDGGNDYNPNGYDPDGGNDYNPNGYDPHGGNDYNRDGYDPDGGNDYNRDGYDPYCGNAYNRNDYDPNGGNDYNRDGYDPYGGNDCNRNDYGPYGGNNYDCDSYDPDGGNDYIPNGYDPDGGNDYNPDGYDPHGGNDYNRDGYDPDGGNDYNPDGFSCDSYVPGGRSDQISIEPVLLSAEELEGERQSSWTYNHKRMENCKHLLFYQNKKQETTEIATGKRESTGVDNTLARYDPDGFGCNSYYPGGRYAEVEVKVATGKRESTGVDNTLARYDPDVGNDYDPDGFGCNSYYPGGRYAEVEVKVATGKRESTGVDNTLARYDPDVGNDYDPDGFGCNSYVPGGRCAQVEVKVATGKRESTGVDNTLAHYDPDVGNDYDPDGFGCNSYVPRGRCAQVEVNVATGKRESTGVDNTLARYDPDVGNDYDPDGFGCNSYVPGGRCAQVEVKVATGKRESTGVDNTLARYDPDVGNDYDPDGFGCNSYVPGGRCAQVEVKVATGKRESTGVDNTLARYDPDVGNDYDPDGFDCNSYVPGGRCAQVDLMVATRNGGSTGVKVETISSTVNSVPPSRTDKVLIAEIECPRKEKEHEGEATVANCSPEYEADGASHNDNALARYNPDVGNDHDPNGFNHNDYGLGHYNADVGNDYDSDGFNRNDYGLGHYNADFGNDYDSDGFGCNSYVPGGRCDQVDLMVATRNGGSTGVKVETISSTVNSVPPSRTDKVLIAEIECPRKEKEHEGEATVANCSPEYEADGANHNDNALARYNPDVGNDHDPDGFNHNDYGLGQYDPDVGNDYDSDGFGCYSYVPGGRCAQASVAGVRCAESSGVDRIMTKGGSKVSLLMLEASSGVSTTCVRVNVVCRNAVCRFLSVGTQNTDSLKVGVKIAPRKHRRTGVKVKTISQTVNSLPSSRTDKVLIGEIECPRKEKEHEGESMVANCSPEYERKTSLEPLDSQNDGSHMKIIPNTSPPPVPQCRKEEKLRNSENSILPYVITMFDEFEGRYQCWAEQVQERISKTQGKTLPEHSDSQNGGGSSALPHHMKISAPPAPQCRKLTNLKPDTNAGRSKFEIGPAFQMHRADIRVTQMPYRMAGIKKLVDVLELHHDHRWCRHNTDSVSLQSTIGVICVEVLLTQTEIIQQQTSEAEQIDCQPSASGPNNVSTGFEDKPIVPTVNGVCPTSRTDEQDLFSEDQSLRKEKQHDGGATEAYGSPKYEGRNLPEPSNPQYGDSSSAPPDQMKFSEEELPQSVRNLLDIIRARYNKVLLERVRNMIVPLLNIQGTTSLEPSYTKNDGSSSSFPDHMNFREEEVQQSENRISMYINKALGGCISCYSYCKKLWERFREMIPFFNTKGTNSLEPSNRQYGGSRSATPDHIKFSEEEQPSKNRILMNIIKAFDDCNANYGYRKELLNKLQEIIPPLNIQSTTVDQETSEANASTTPECQKQCAGEDVELTSMDEEGSMNGTPNACSTEVRKVPPNHVAFGEVEERAIKEIDEEIERRLSQGEGKNNSREAEIKNEKHGDAKKESIASDKTVSNKFEVGLYSRSTDVENSNSSANAKVSAGMRSGTQAGRKSFGGGSLYGQPQLHPKTQVQLQRNVKNYTFDDKKLAEIKNKNKLLQQRLKCIKEGRSPLSWRAMSEKGVGAGRPSQESRKSPLDSDNYYGWWWYMTLTWVTQIAERSPCKIGTSLKGFPLGVPYLKRIPIYYHNQTALMHGRVTPGYSTRL